MDSVSMQRRVTPRVNARASPTAVERVVVMTVAAERVVNARAQKVAVRARVLPYAFPAASTRCAGMTVAEAAAALAPQEPIARRVNVPGLS